MPVITCSSVRAISVLSSSGPSQRRIVRSFGWAWVSRGGGGAAATTGAEAGGVLLQPAPSTSRDVRTVRKSHFIGTRCVINLAISMKLLPKAKTVPRFSQMHWASNGRLHYKLFLTIAVACFAANVYADDLLTMGVTALRNLDPSLVGTGIRVGQAEALPGDGAPKRLKSVQQPSTNADGFSLTGFPPTGLLRTIQMPPESSRLMPITSEGICWSVGRGSAQESLIWIILRRIFSINPT